MPASQGQVNGQEQEQEDNRSLSKPSPSGELNIAPTALLEPGEQVNLPPTKKSKKDEMPAVPLLLNTPEFLAAWKDWEQHRLEIKKKLTPMAVTKQYNEMVGWGVEKSVQLINNAIAKGWQGIFDVRENGSNGHGKPSHSIQADGTYRDPMGEQRAKLILPSMRIREDGRWDVTGRDGVTVIKDL